jgi:hypothetical protein
VDFFECGTPKKMGNLSIIREKRRTGKMENAFLELIRKIVGEKP